METRPAALLNALRAYQAGRFVQALDALGPALSATSVAQPVLLLAAQIHARLAKHEAAAAFYLRAADLGGPNGPALRALAASMLQQAGHAELSLTTARAAFRSGPSDPVAHAIYRRCLRDYLCIDEALADDIRLLERMQHNEPGAFAIEEPFDNINWCADEALNVRQTRIENAAPFTPASRASRRARPHVFGEKIRIGYLSGDFSDAHPLARLMQGVLSLHDRQRFEIHLFCNTDAAKIAADRGFRRRHPEIVSVRALGDDDAAELIRGRNIDVLVDLSGHMQDSRIGILNRGGAPVQVAYIGYPGAGTGIDCDYVIGDYTILPTGSEAFYQEKICRLPETYFAEDNLFRTLPAPVLRSDAGLPADKVVFASFNAVRKITHRTAQIWAEILRRTGDSVLWIRCPEHLAADHFVAWMESHGIARERIILAATIERGRHMGRIQAADLGLDTFPFNGHTTTADMLWAGVPVATFKGTHFASRVGETLLRALNVPELVAENASDYIALCVGLATDRQRLETVRAKIASNRTTAPLFDTQRTTRYLEAAFDMMVARAKAGLPPDHFDVPSFGLTPS